MQGEEGVRHVLGLLGPRARALVDAQPLRDRESCPTIGRDRENSEDE